MAGSVKKIKVGSVGIAVWENNGINGAYYTVSIEKLWDKTPCFFY